MSFRNEYILNVDIKRRMTSIVPTFKQGDSATLKFRIFDDGKAFDLSDFTRAEITFRLPSNQTIVGEPYVDENTNMVVYEFVGVEMSEVGKLETILSIYSGTSMVSIQPFSVWIFDHLKDKDLSYIGILQDLIAEVQLLKQEVEETLSEAIDLKDKLNDVLNEANNSEQIRNTNEQNRITSENTRDSNESTRQQNELDRKNAESVRESNEATRIQNEQNRQNEFDNKINEAEEAITDTKKATDKANQAADSIKGWGQATVWNSTTTYSKNNVVTYNGSTWQSKGDNNLNSIPSETNTNWILLALRGVDGTGAVSTVNGKSPDGAGNVELTADEIGTYTQQQIDDKDTAVKEYFTDKGIGDKVIVISEQDYIDADYNGMFWVKNDTLDFLPTETDHAATLLVYENPDNGNAVKIFNVINPTTAISYMRTYTYDNASSLIHDSGWIEGGGGSGTGGGNVGVNSYPLVTDSVSQTIWELPTGTYNQVTDSVMVFHNTVFLDQVSYTLTNNRLSIPDNPHTEIAKNNVVLVVFRNMPNMKLEFDGNNIIDGSIPLSKLGQDVQDAINNAGTQVEIVNDLTTGGADKALSAEMGKDLKQEIDNSWQKGVYNDTDIMNLEQINVSRIFSIAGWKAPTNNLEMVSIVIPAENFGGNVKVSVVSSWGNSKGAGTFEYETHYVKNSNLVNINERTIYKADQNITTEYFFPDFNVNEDVFTIPIVRKPNAINWTAVKVEVLTVHDAFDMLKDAYLVYEDLGTSWTGYPWTPQKSNIPTGRDWLRWDTSMWNDFLDGRNFVVNGTLTNITLFNPAQFRDFLQGFLINKMGTFKCFAQSQDLGLNNLMDMYGVLTVIKPWENESGGGLKQRFETSDVILKRYQIDDNTWSAWVCIQSKDVDIVKLFQSVSNGKAQVASAITGKGVPTASDATFETMANNINAIQTQISVKGEIPLSPIPSNGLLEVYTPWFDFQPMYFSSTLPGVSLYNGFATPQISTATNAFYILSLDAYNQVVNGVLQWRLKLLIKNAYSFTSTQNKIDYFISK